MNETIDDLQCGGMKLIQEADGFKFGTDAVLLADFASGCRAERALDLCCGNGIIPVLLAAKTKIREIWGVEIQKDAADLAKRSVGLNGLEERVKIINGDLKDCGVYFEKRYFDMITCNPPYMKAGAAIINNEDAKTIARHEVKCTLEDIMSVSCSMLLPGGRFFMIHRPVRMAEAIACMKRYKIEPKRLRLVYPDEKSEPVLFLTEGLLFGKEELRIAPPLFLKDSSGGESEELKRIYNRGRMQE